MRQLTPLDAQFLAIETSRTYGHVGGLAVYDPSTAPGGELGVDDLCRLVSERVHLLPPFRWRLAQVPLGLDLPYWTEDEDFDLDFHIRESAVPPPGDDRQLGETVARIFARPLDRSRPLWELYVIQGLEHGRVALLTKVHHSVVDGVSGNEIRQRPARLEPGGPGDRASAGRRRAARPPPRRARDAGPRAGRPGAPAGARAALGAHRPAQPHGPARRQRLPGRADALAGADRRPARAGRTAGPRHPRDHDRAAAAHLLQRPDLGPPQLRLRLRLAGHGQGDQGRGGREGERRRGGRLRRRGPRVAARARRAPRRAARSDGPRLRPGRGRAGHVRQPDLDDDRPDPHRRGRLGAAPRARARAAAEREGAARRPARRPAHRRVRLHPAGGRGARRAHHRGDPRPHAAAAQPGRLERAGAALAALHRRGAARVALSRCRRWWTAWGST